MKNYLRKWLGISNPDFTGIYTRIANIEKRLGKEKPKPVTDMYHFPNLSFDWGFGTPKDNSLTAKISDLRDDFEELDKKFDALERYLQIEYYKEDKETQVYDWADKKHAEGFRACKRTYDQMKRSKEKREKDEDEG